VKLYTDYNAVDGMVVTRPVDTASAAIQWREYDFGTLFQGGYKYQAGSFGKGDVILGGQIDAMIMYDSFYPSGRSGELTTINDRKNNLLLEKGSEEIYSGFAQVKHFFTDKIIANFGFRYDSKNRHKGDPVSDISPRLAIIWNPYEFFDLKASYSKSFVDAPYWYRYNTLASYKGSSGLLPEHLSSMQLSFGFHFLDNKLTYQLNGFRNELTDIIFRDVTATGDAPRYKNAGMLKSFGIENDLRFITKPISVFANFTWQYADSAKDYSVTEHEINNVPSVFGNIAVNYYPFHQKQNRLILNITLRYIGEQASPISAGYKNGVAYSDPNFKIDAAFLVNAALTFRNFYGFTLQLQATNLADTKYYQGGAVRFPYPQQGRWYSLRLIYKF
jgi:iron complex outermembrane receptor protein